MINFNILNSKSGTYGQVLQAPFFSPLRPKIVVEDFAIEKKNKNKKVEQKPTVQLGA